MSCGLGEGVFCYISLAIGREANLYYGRLPVVFYDQLGNGNSSLCMDAPEGFWTPDLFLDQLESLLKALGIYYDFDLLGHSFGGAYTSPLMEISRKS